MLTPARGLAAVLISVSALLAGACGPSPAAPASAVLAPVAQAPTAQAPAAHAGRAVPAPPEGLSMFVLGDSYVSGTAEDDGYLWQEIIADDFHWALDWDGVGGTGYITADPQLGPAYGKRLHADLARPIGSHNPTFMVVAGGNNDRYKSPTAVAAGAKKLFDRIDRKLPHTRLVVISPWVPVRAEHVPALDAALRKVTIKAGGYWIDTHRWFLNHPDLIGADHDHPTEAGHHFLARRIGDILAKLAPKS